MKTLLKLALAGTALAAAAAHADVALPTAPGGGDLILFVQDTALSNVTYARDIGISLNSLFPSSATVPTSSYTGPIALTASFNVGPDSNLHDFLTAHAADLAAGKIQWAVEAGTFDGTKTPNQNGAPGAARFLTTTSQSLASVTAQTTTNITNKFISLNQDLKNLNNFGGAGATPLGAGNLSTPATGDGIWGTSNGLTGNQNWYGALSTAGTFASSTGSTSQAFYGLTGNSGRAAQVYTFGNIFFDANGTLHISSVPIPAALWLFGSGLLGLVGLGRRRSEAVAA
jgi:hypothetical protein